MALKVLPGPKLSERTTLRLGGRARAEVVLERAEDAHALGEALAGLEARPFALGWGSNLLARDQEMDLAIVSLAPGEEPVTAGADDAGRTLLDVSGAMMLPRLVNWAAARGLSGLEPLAGIPGTVGGSVAMNAGSYGREIAELLVSVRIWDAAEGPRELAPGQWSAGYRRFVPLGAQPFWLALGARLALTRDDPQAVRARTDETLARKKATQPVSAATCGCVFKNPPGASAGRMLDELGFKGRSLGGMSFSPMHANFLVNEGRGSSVAALELLAKARAAVQERFGVALELEVRVLP